MRVRNRQAELTAQIEELRGRLQQPIVAIAELACQDDLNGDGKGDFVILWSGEKLRVMVSG